MFSKIKNYIIAFSGAIIAVLFGLLKYEKYKRNEVETELKNKDIELEIKDIEGDVKTFETINIEKAKEVKNEIKQDENTPIKSNSNYKL